MLPGVKQVEVPDTLKTLVHKSLDTTLPDEYKLTVIEDKKALLDYVAKSSVVGSPDSGTKLKMSLVEHMYNLQHGCLTPGEATELRDTLRELIKQKGKDASPWLLMLGESLAKCPETPDESLLNHFH
jgi:hypothetical protein